MLCSNKNKGFTLVELAIVIVIIGAIVAGIVAGISLIKQAKLRATVSEIQTLQQAYLNFRLKYDAIPGDMSNASSFLSGAANGNGDKIMNGFSVTGNTEGLSAFYHLATAELIPGAFTGTLGSGIVIGKNVPKSAYSADSIYWFYGNNLWTNYSNGNSLVISGPLTLGYDDPKVLVNDASQIDLKIDDGEIYIGKIVSYNVTSGCVNQANHKLSDYGSGSPATPIRNVAYNLSNASEKCALHAAFDDYKFVPKP